jgi:pyridoxamine 5'-phosphate oxidase family protein
VPVAFTVEPDDSIRVSGFALTESAKWRNLGRDPRFSLVADEGIGTDARGVMLRGTAERIESGETAPMLLLRATRVVSWGVDSRPFSRVARDIAAP